MSAAVIELGGPALREHAESMLRVAKRDGGPAAYVVSARDGWPRWRPNAINCSPGYPPTLLSVRCSPTPMTRSAAAGWS